MERGLIRYASHGVAVELCGFSGRRHVGQERDYRRKADVPSAAKRSTGRRTVGCQKMESIGGMPAEQTIPVFLRQSRQTLRKGPKG